ncbi:hypothetical protein P0136_08440 [Lentisphaerota bacterium ZTH]|nr:hypothetical protein JYG24_00455 [Lentisphaerota bacterium]WET05393.1 hypothetical protein P0136_08440 [Lentisphaerota bacterium ZTH]
MPNKYENLFDNIRDISSNCNMGNYYLKLKLPGGLCFGLSHMWGQAVLAQDVATFNSRMDLLTKAYPCLTGVVPRRKLRLSSVLNGILLKARQRHNLSEEELLYLSIFPFLDGLLMYHCPEKTSFPVNGAEQKPMVQNAVSSSRFVLNDRVARITDGKMAALGKVYHRPYMGTRRDYAMFLRSIFETVNSFEIPFFVAFGSLRHEIGLSFINNQMYIYDANIMKNNGYYYQMPLSNMRQFIEKLFSTLVHDDYLAVDISIYIRPEDIDKSLSLNNDFYLSYMKAKLVWEVRDYSKQRVWHMHWHRHISRAKFTLQKVSEMRLARDIKQYLEEEKQLCEGVNLQLNISIITITEAPGIIMAGQLITG